MAKSATQYDFTFKDRDGNTVTRKIQKGGFDFTAGFTYIGGNGTKYPVIGITDESDKLLSGKKSPCYMRGGYTLSTINIEKTLADVKRARNCSIAGYSAVTKCTKGGADTPPVVLCRGYMICDQDPDYQSYEGSVFCVAVNGKCPSAKKCRQDETYGNIEKQAKDVKFLGLELKETNLNTAVPE